MIAIKYLLQFTQEIFKGPIKVFAGGDHSFLIIDHDRSGPIDFRAADHRKQILTLTIPKLAACEVFKDSDVVNQVSWMFRVLLIGCDR